MHGLVYLYVSSQDSNSVLTLAQHVLSPLNHYPSPVHADTDIFHSNSALMKPTLRHTPLCENPGTHKMVWEFISIPTNTMLLFKMSMSLCAASCHYTICSVRIFLKNIRFFKLEYMNSKKEDYSRRCKLPYLTAMHCICTDLVPHVTYIHTNCKNLTPQ